MGSNAINSLNNSYVQSLFTALQSTATTATGDNVSSSSTTALTSTGSDNSQLSPFAQLVSTLQQLQQWNPTDYAKVTQQISTNLQAAAQGAQQSGNTAEASQLNQLASDFSKASSSGQLPNIQDLAQAVHGHHHGGGGDKDASSSTSDPFGSISSSVSNTLTQLEQLFSSSQSGGTQANDPASVIFSALSQAGLSGSNG
jgi:hypothetical protein